MKNTVEVKKMQLELSRKIAKDLISKGIKDIEPLTKETIHMMTRKNCGDYILKLPRLSDAEFKVAEIKETDHETWNMFFTLLKLDFIYYRKSI